MSDIQITTEGTHTTLASPYHPDMPAKARAIGGKFDRDARTWGFDARDEQRVRDLAIEFFGTDGAPTELVTIRLHLDRISSLSRERVRTLRVAGREIAHRPGRNDDVRLGDGVIIIDGGFPGYGGSTKYPDLEPLAGTVLEVRDVPRRAAEKDMGLLADGAVLIVGDQGVDVDALLAERDRLLARLAEIDAQLPEPEGTTATTRQAAEALGVSVRTVRRWAQTGKVDAAKNDAGHWVVTITIGR